MADLVNTQTGAVEPIPDHQAEQAIRSGKYTFAKGSKVAVRNEVGRVGHLDAEEAMAALHRGSVSLATDDQVHTAHLEKKYGGLGGTVAAGAEGAARGLTLGLSDPAAIAAARALGGEESAEKVRTHLREEKEAHPYLSTGAEIAGAAAPVLLSGGAGAAAEGAEAVEGGSALVRGIRAAGGLPRAVAGLGRGLERGAATMLGEGAEGFAARIAQRAIPMGIAGAGEGAAYGVGGAISEDALNGGDHELTAEQLLAAAGHGAVFGGLVGGGLGAASEVVASGARAAAERAGLALSEREGVQGLLREHAEKQAWRSLSPGKAFTEQAEARAGGAQAVGRTLLDEGVLDASTIRESARTPADLLPRVTEAKERIGAQLGEAMRSSKATASAGDIFAPLNTIIEREGQKAGFEPIVQSLVSYRDSLAGKMGLVDPSTGRLMAGAMDRQVPIADLWHQRKALDDLVFRESRALDPKLRVGLLREFRGQIADLEMTSIDKASQEAGSGATYAELKTLRQKYQHLSLAEDALEKTTAAYATNRNISMSGYLTAVGAMASGHLLAAPIVAVAHQLVKERGNAVAARFLDRLSHMGALEQAANDVNRQIGQGIRGYLSRTAELIKRETVPVSMRIAIGRSSRDLRASYERRRDEVQALANPGEAQARIAAGLGTLPSHAPNVAAAVSLKAMQTASYLAAKLPHPSPGGSLLQGHLKGPPPSDSEMSEWLRLDALLQKPTRLIGEIRAGRATQSEANAVRDNAPKIFAQMQKTALDAIAARPSEVPYEKRKMLGILLGIPTDPTLAPEFVADIQAGYAHEPTEAQPGAAPKKDKGGGRVRLPKQDAVQIAQRDYTDVDRAEQSGDTTV